jgi:hypothetical protein
VHDGICDRLTECCHRVLRDIFTLEFLDPVCRPRVPFDESECILDIRDDAAVEVLPVEDMDFDNAFEEEAGDVCLVEEPARMRSRL